MADHQPVFHMLELAAPATSDGKRKVYLYATVSNGEPLLNLTRVRNINDWETEIYRASLLFSNTESAQSRRSNAEVRLRMDYNENHSS
ncbi:hypothetical protein BgAZ_206360 [Babesia gibsoni]|uniref:Uncharacterized protein n=1 Tax=Babesia gibsoni TaxID=33632 RepID=A0AAD8P9M8_BABGI|nr:hypothetical protein BgAZ_206360 [Babesia gibsoni]